MKKILSVFFLACCSCIVMAQDNVIDEIVWVVGDDAILRSDIETQRLYNQNEGVRLDGDPYCVIPEQMAIQKLYLNQAKIDSITVNENQVIQSVDQWMNMAVTKSGLARNWRNISVRNFPRSRMSVRRWCGSSR